MKKQLAFISALLCFVMLLAACGGKAPEPTPEPAPAPEASEPTAPEPEDAPAALEGEIIFWTMWNDTEAQGEVFQQIADNFMAENPGTKVTIQWCGRDISKTLKPALESGEQIDVFDYPSQYGDQLREFCADLTNLKNTQYDFLDGKSLSDVLLPAMFESPKKTTGISDIQVGIGYKPWMSLFMYNADVLEEAGVTSNPTTWAELDEACAKIKEAGYVPLTFDDAYAVWLPGLYLARAESQDWVMELVNDTTGEMWKSDAVMNMAEAYADFASKGYFDANVSGNLWPAGQMDVGNEKVAMYLNLTGLPSELADVTRDDFRWGAFNFPDVVDGQSRSKNEAVLGATVTAVNADAENMDVAEAFVAYMHTKQSDTMMVENSGMTTSRVDGEWPKALEGVKPAFDGITEVQKAGGGIDANADITPVISENFIKLASGQITAQQFVDNMVAAAS